MFFCNSLKAKEIDFGVEVLLRAFAALCLAVALGLAARPALAQVPGGLTGSPIEEQVEEDTQEQVEESVEEEIEDSVVDAGEEAVEEAVEDAVDELVLGPGAEQAFQDAIEKALEDEVTDAVEEETEENVEETVEEQTEEEIAEAVEETVEEQVSETVTEDLENDVEENVEEQVEETVADNVEETVEDQLEESVQEEVAESVEENVEDSIADVVAESAEAGTAEQVASNVEEQLESEIDAILDGIESDLDVDENRIQRQQWLVMAEPEVFDELADKGYLFDTVTDLPALGMRLAEVAGPESFDITEVRRGVLDVVGKDRAEVDLNHLYTAGSEIAAVDEGLQPGVVMALPAAAAAPRIGMIDSSVDTAHPALAGANIRSQSFVPEQADTPAFHGTAVASIITANTGDYRGLVPGAELYAAGVFQVDSERGEIASTVSLLRALDWLIASDVDVVNISLAGPANRLLETALKRAAEQDVIVLAAAGNGGPVARPMYPAAYETVVAVTAVDNDNQVFRLANRGSYLDIAAPGVGLLHARAGGGFAASSGTSFAVPFATTAVATLRQQQPGVDVLEQIFNSAVDLGPPGRDEIYGYGLLRIAGL